MLSLVRCQKHKRLIGYRVPFLQLYCYWPCRDCLEEKEARE